MKRIGVDAHVLTGKFQGSRTYLLNLLCHLGEIDRQNRYLLYSFDPDATRALLPFANFEHLRLAVRPGVPRLLFYWPWEQWRRRLDLLLTSYFCPLVFARRQIVIVHDLLFESHPQYFGRAARLRFKLLVRLSASRARNVVAVSHTTRTEILRCYRLPPSRVHIVSGGTSAQAAAPDVSDSPYAIPYILAVGRLEPRKNIAALLRAFRLMKTPGVHLVIIGREDFGASETVAELRSLQEDPATRARVMWLTEVQDTDLPAAYRHAAVFAFPSFAEGFGLPVLEALAQGTPVVASGHEAMREVGGAFCRYFEPNGPDADRQFADLLDLAIKEGAPGTPEACATHVASFNWTRSAHAMLGIINDTPGPVTTPSA